VSAALLQDVRGDFPVLERTIDGKPLVYMDSAATSLKPRQVIDAVTRFYSQYTANIHRGRHLLSEEASDRFEESRSKIALAMGCAGDEVVFVRNTTEALNLVPQLLGIRSNDLIVGLADTHHSNLLPWRRCARYTSARQLADGTPDLEHLESLLRLGPKIVAVTHGSNVTGMYAPLAAISRLARAAGARVVVDAAQSAPHRRIRFREMGVDFLAFSGHKMLGPSGIGCLIGATELLSSAQPVHLGGGTVDNVSAEDWLLRRSPHRHEAGTPAIEAAGGLGAAIDYLEAIGFERLAAHERLLSAALTRAVRCRPYLHPVGNLDCEDRAPLVSFAVENCGDLRDLVKSLSDAYGIMCRSGHLCAQPLVDSHTDGEVLRVSAYLYNTVAEVEQVFEALDELVRAFARAPARGRSKS
jgi:cysteine desulfurase/selenocysteine lyase